MIRTTNTLTLSVTSDASASVQTALHDVALAAKMDGHEVGEKAWPGLPGIAEVTIERSGPPTPFSPRVEHALVMLYARAAGVEE